MSKPETTRNLVEHLRFRAASAGYPKRELYDAAADEIERLRDQIAYLEKCFLTGKRPV